MPTIKDIAKLAGVTYVSVSRALNNEPGVSEKTRRKILDIAEQINYVPNLAAKRLVDRSSNGIGLIWPKSEDPFFYRTCNQIQEEASRRGFTVMVSLAEREEALRSFQEFFIHRAVCWLKQRPTPEYIKAKESFRGTMLEVGGWERWKQEKAHRIDIDRGGAIFKAVQHLVERGHRRIAFIGGRSEKWLGYTEASMHFQLEYQPELNVLISINDPDKTQKIEAFLNGCHESGATAAIIDSEGAFRDFARIIRDKGIGVPSDLSVVVYDDVPEIQALLPVLITTVGPAIALLANKIIDLITHEAEAAEEGVFLRKVVDTELIIRQSTRELV